MNNPNKSVYVNNDYLSYIVNTLHLYITNPSDTVSMVIRLLNKRDAKALFTVISPFDKLQRVYEFPISADDAKYFMTTGDSSSDIQDYRYDIQFQGNHCHVIQYEELPEGQSRKRRINVFDVPLQVTSRPLSVPIIYGDTTCEINQRYIFGVSAFVQIPASEEDALITTFIIEYLSYSLSYFVLPNRRYAEFEFELFIDPRFGFIEELPVTVTVIDDKRHKSSTTLLLTIDNGKIYMPEIIQPYPGEFVSSTSKLFVEGSEFQTTSTAYNPIHEATDYLITTDYEGNNPVFEHTGHALNELTSATLYIDPPLHREGEINTEATDATGETVVYDGVYYLRIRYKERRLGYSFWSRPRLLHVTEDFTETISRPYIIGPSDIYVGRDYQFLLESKPITADSVSKFVVTYKDKKTEIQAVDNKAIFDIHVEPSDYGHIRLLLVQAFDNEGKNSFYQYLELNCVSYTKVGDLFIGMPKYGVITIDRASLLSNTQIDDKAIITSVVACDAINGVYTNNSDGSVTFKATGSEYDPASFDFAVTDSFGLTYIARACISLLKPVPIKMNIFQFPEDIEEFIAMNSPTASFGDIFCADTGRVWKSIGGKYTQTTETVQQNLGAQVPCIGISAYNNKMFEITKTNILLYYE